MTDDFFKKHNLDVIQQDVTIGTTYPLYGCITKILSEGDGIVEVELNYSTLLQCHLTTPEQIEKIKQRAFEPGIFVTEITATDPVKGKCTTIVFGKMSTPEV